MSYKQSAFSLKYICIWLYISCEVQKPSGVSSAKWKAWGIPSVSVAFAKGGSFHAHGNVTYRNHPAAKVNSMTVPHAKR